MKIVLDTCAVLWAVLNPEKLSTAAKQVLTEVSTEVYVSAISCAEIACGVERKRLELDRHWKPWFRHFTQLNGWRVVPMEPATVEEAYSLPEYAQRDPADRLIVATARILRCAVVTADRLMQAYPHVDCVW